MEKLTRLALTACLGGILMLGCVRMLAPAGVTPPTGRQGESCTADNACASGFCTDGVCCDTRCPGEGEACHLPSSLGTCQQKRKGNACTEASQCPSGAPVCGGDGVCCESECKEACHSCNNPGAPGACLPVADNTDPEGECAGDCTSCQGGMCGPTLPGIDPQGDCAANAACNGFGACAIDLGQVCDDTRRCANGACILGKCRLVQVEELQLRVPFAGIADFRATSLDTGPEGRSVVGFTTVFARQTAGTGAYQSAPGPLMLAIEVSQAVWRSPVASFCTRSVDWIATTRVGAMSLGVVAQHADNPLYENDKCGRSDGSFETILVSPSGQLLDRQKFDGVQPAFETNGTASVTVTSQGTVVAALVTGGDKLKVATRPSGETTWTMVDLRDGDHSWGHVSAVEMAGTTAIVDFARDEPQLRLHLLGSDDVTRVSFPADCMVLDELNLQVLPNTSGQRAMVTFACDIADVLSLHTPGVALVDLSLPVPQRITQPAYVEFANFPDGISVASSQAQTVAPGPLEDGSPGLFFADRLENVWWAYQLPGGRWETFPIQVLGNLVTGQHVRNLVAHRGPRGMVAVWTQQYRFLDETGQYQAANESKLVMATITP